MFFGFAVTALPPGVPAGSNAFDRTGTSTQFGKGWVSGAHEVPGVYELRLESSPIQMPGPSRLAGPVRLGPMSRPPPPARGTKE